MKAVIPAAGLGTRFLPATKAQPKEMLPVVDKPVIQFVVEEAVAAGVDDVLIVTGRGKRAIEDHFDRAFELEAVLDANGKCEALAGLESIANLADIHYIRQKYPKGLGHAILCGERHVAHDHELPGGVEERRAVRPFLVLLGDVIIPANDCIPRLIELYEKHRCSIIAVEKVEPEAVQRYGIIAGTRVEAGVWQVTDLVEKPTPKEAPSNLAIFGRYLLTPSIFRHLRDTPPGRSGEIQLTDALKSLLAEEPIYAVELKSQRYDIGNKLSWMEANVKLALKDPEIGRALREYLKHLVCQ